MNKEFLKDLADAVKVTPLESYDPYYMSEDYLIRLYIAEKLWSIEQLLKHQGGR